MNLPMINTAADVTEATVDSLTGLAQNLSQQSDEVIQTLASSPVLDPDIQQALASEDAALLLADDPSQEAASDDNFSFINVDADLGLLSFPGVAAMGVEADASGFWLRIKSAFTGLRRKVRRLFCQVVAKLENAQDLNLKQIIKDVLFLAIPAFAGATGLMPVVLPIVVSLAAILIKHGVSQVCPV